MIEINLRKAEKGTHTGQVTVRRGGKVFQREQRLGRKSGREGTGKIDKLPDAIKKEILELRQIGEPGTEIKAQIETMIEMSPDIHQKLVDANVITMSQQGLKLTVTPQALTDYAKKRGVIPTRAHGPKSKESIQAEEKGRHDETKKYLKQAEKKVAELEIELKQLSDRRKADKVQAAGVAERYSHCLGELATAKNK